MNRFPFVPFGSYSSRAKARVAAKLMPFSVKVVKGDTCWSLLRTR